MFSGIIQELGKIAKIEKYDGGSLFSIECVNINSEINLGDSISVNGVCLTATKIKNSIFDVNVVQETLNVSILSDLHEGDSVNLELSLKYNDRISGHLVQGHVESIGKIIAIKENGTEEVRFTINIDDNIKKYCIYKGSIAIDGISLTIAAIKDNMIDVAVIPYTLNHTNLKYKKINNKVNIETDMMSKYVEKILNK
tara:strand:- start:318 stop:908 length:591 start_codon:yes stop_codon:yes gene_type:complete